MRFCLQTSEDQLSTPSAQAYTISGQHISMIARNYLPEQTAAPPVVLIVGWDKRYWETDERAYATANMSRKPKFYSSWERDLYDSPPFHGPSTVDGELFLERRRSESVHQGTRTYQKALDRTLGLKYNTQVPDEDIAVLCLMPLMSLETISLQVRSRLLQAQIVLEIEGYNSLIRVANSTEKPSELQEQRSWIRRHIGSSSVLDGSNGAVRDLNRFNFQLFTDNQLVLQVNQFKPIVNWLTNSLPSF